MIRFSISRKQALNTWVFYRLLYFFFLFCSFPKTKCCLCYIFSPVYLCYQTAMVHYLSEVMALIKEQANNNNKYNSHITRIFMENVCDLVLLFIVFFIFIYLFFFQKAQWQMSCICFWAYISCCDPEGNVYITDKKKNNNNCRIHYVSILKDRGLRKRKNNVWQCSTII